MLEGCSKGDSDVRTFESDVVIMGYVHAEPKTNYEANCKVISDLIIEKVRATVVVRVGNSHS